MRLAVGQVRDVVMVDGVVRALPAPGPTQAVGDAFAAKAGFDPRTQKEPYPFFHIRPQRIQAWREVNEIAGRDLMRDGAWLP